jgi:hypothetical protein
MRLILLIGLMMVVAACAGGDSATEATVETVSDDFSGGAAPPETAAPEEAAGAPEGEGVALGRLGDRKVIHTAAISIEAEDTRAAYRRIQAMVEEGGGFIQSATVADVEASEDQPRIDLVVRIPAGDLTNTLEAIGALGTRIVSQSQQGQDVTEEYVDLEARIENLSLLERELRALLAEVRQNPEADPQKLLEVFNEISRVRGEIEQLEGRRRLLDELTDLATVEIAIDPTPAATPVVAEGWAPLAVARQALQDLVGAGQGVVDFLIRFGIYVLPLLLVFVGVPALVVWRFRNRLRPKRHAPEA